MRKLHILLIAIFLGLLANAQDTRQKREPSTPEERKRFVKITRQLINSPLSEDRNGDVKWALKWLEEVPDVNVDPCPLPLGNIVPSGYKYSARVFGVYVMSMGVYAIEHPEKGADDTPQYLAGVEGALKAYLAILQEEPDASSKNLDDLVKMKEEGKLEMFVRESGKLCKAP